MNDSPHIKKWAAVIDCRSFLAAALGGVAEATDYGPNRAQPPVSPVPAPRDWSRQNPV